MTDAPVAAPAAPATAAPNTPPAPVDPLAEHLGAIERAGGIPVKVNGKTVKMTMEQLTRYAQKNAPIDSAMQALQKQREELSPKMALLQQLEAGSEDEQTEALEKLLGSKFVSVAEKRLLKEIQSQQKYEGMSERERQMAQQLERLEGEKRTAEQQRQAMEKAQQDARESQEVAHWQNVLGAVATGALTQLELPERLEPLAIKLVQPVMRELMAAGQVPTADDVAKHIEDVLESVVEWSFRGGRGERALKRHAPALRAYATHQLAAIQKPNGGAPRTNGNQAPVAKNTSVTPVWDPRSVRK